ncbi:MAG: LLM class flavin-dependent oxidoreductase [Candidatus Binatia bacterium]
MEFGLQVANLDFPRYRDVAQEAEALGFHLITFPDHIVHERPGGQYDERTLAYDPMITAAVVIEATKKIQVGHLVLCNLFRHPAITAQSLATLDQLSDGRVIAGLGTGWTETEFRMTGIAFPDIATRLAMLDEALSCMRSLWTNERTTFEGRHYRFNEAILHPKPKHALSILIGGGGKGLLRVAAKHADVVNIIADVGKAGRIEIASLQKLTNEAYRAKIGFLREEARRAGRDGAAIRMSNVIFTLMLTESRRHAEDALAGMAPVFGTTPEGMRQSPMALIGTPEDCIVELKRRVRDWDIQQFIFSGGAENQMSRLWNDVLRHV